MTLRLSVWLSAWIENFPALVHSRSQCTVDPVAFAVPVVRGRGHRCGGDRDRGSARNHPHAVRILAGAWLHTIGTAGKTESPTTPPNIAPSEHCSTTINTGRPDTGQLMREPPDYRSASLAAIWPTMATAAGAVWL
jgi:hypothetical protein